MLNFLFSVGLWWYNRFASCYKQALIEVNDREIFERLTCCCSERDEREKGAVATQLVRERAKIILDEVRDLSLVTHLQCLKHIGTIMEYCMFSLLFHYQILIAYVNSCHYKFRRAFPTCYGWEGE
jgi:hypothetical protein